ncbi:hypothetical protein IFR05_013622 [Cadophora sp. M221]|nr:hypothetical protein IFR05_013622 [Cadophora sp. M221]
MDPNSSSVQAGDGHPFKGPRTSGTRDKRHTMLGHASSTERDPGIVPGGLDLEARVQALEYQVQLLRCGPGQHTNISGAQASYHSATPTILNSAQEDEAFEISDSPATDGSGLPFTQPIHQNGVSGCTGYGPMLLSQYNSVGEQTGPPNNSPHRASHSGDLLPYDAPPGPSLANNNFYPADSSGYSYASGQPTLGSNTFFTPTHGSGYFHGAGQRSLENTTLSPDNNLRFLLPGSALFSGDEHIAVADNLGSLPANSELFLGDSNFNTGHVHTDQSPGTNQTLLLPPQFGRDFQIADNSGGNGYHNGDYMNSMSDFPAASMPSDTSVDMGYNMLDINQADVNHGNIAATPANPMSVTSGSTGAPAARPRMHRCVVSMHCHQTFARRADRDRHSLTHDRHSIRQYPCTFQGCERVGAKGFWRRDKLNEHIKRGH